MNRSDTTIVETGPQSSFTRTYSTTTDVAHMSTAAPRTPIRVTGRQRRLRMHLVPSVGLCPHPRFRKTSGTRIGLDEKKSIRSSNAVLRERESGQDAPHREAGLGAQQARPARRDRLAGELRLVPELDLVARDERREDRDGLRLEEAAAEAGAGA
jgi:hypothetical protein